MRPPKLLMKENRMPMQRRQRQQGFVAVIVSIALLAMVAMTGLALDLGKLYVVKSELQNSADACALAAALELTGANAGQIELARAAGIAAGSRHKVMFQDENISLSDANSVQFSTDNSPGSFISGFGLVGTAALSMRYVRCSVTRANIPTWFIQVASVLPGGELGLQQVSASAIANLQPSQTTCAMPTAICSSAMTPTPPVGKWLSGIIGPPGNQGLSGNFNWIDFTPPNGGAAELDKLISGNGVCELPPEGLAVGQAGNIASIATAFNTRFGIYKGGISPDDAAPDISGYAYTDFNWDAAAGNAFDDFKNRRASNAPYQTDAMTGLKTQGSISNATFLRDNGHERRMMIAPVVDCDAFSSSSTAPIVSWACIFLLHPINNNAGSGGAGTGQNRMYLEYHGKSTDLLSPCSSYGLPGGDKNKGPLVATLVK